MKNLCFIDYNVSNMGGIERVLVSLCNELSKKYNIHLISICGDYKDCKYKIGESVKCYNVGNPSNSRIRKLIVSSASKLIRYIRKNSIDVVFMVGHFTPPIILPIKFFIKSKMVFCDHGALMNQYDDKKAVMFRILASKLCSKTVVLTERTRNDYINVLKVKPDKIICIYNWLDDEMKKFIGQYNIKSKKIVSVGRLSYEKGYATLADVAKTVFDRHPDWEWHIYGDGEERDKIKKKVQEQKIDKNLLLKGPTNKMYEKYKDYGIYVMTSYREGLPLVLIEAKANRLPIVSFDCVTGPAEIVRDGVDGYLIECYNKEMMAEKICSLIEDDYKRISFSKETSKNLNLFEKDSILDKWISLINNL